MHRRQMDIHPFVKYVHEVPKGLVDSIYVALQLVHAVHASQLLVADAPKAPHILQALLHAHTHRHRPERVGLMSRGAKDDPFMVNCPGQPWPSL